LNQKFAYAESGGVSTMLNGNGETHISSKGTFPILSIIPGVDELLGKAAAIKHSVFNVPKFIKGCIVGY
jgi:hypothetical protein